MIRMEVGQKMGGHASKADTSLPQPDGDASTEIEEQRLLTGFDQRALAEAVSSWSGRAGAKQRDSEIAGPHWRGRERQESIGNISPLPRRSRK